MSSVSLPDVRGLTYKSVGFRVSESDMLNSASVDEPCSVADDPPLGGEPLDDRQDR